MAFATYFEKNAHAASTLLRGLDSAVLRSRLQNEVIAVYVDSSVPKSKEGRAGVDLTIRLLARVYPVICVAGESNTPAAYLQELRSLAQGINPDIEVIDALDRATRALVFGGTAPPPSGPSAPWTWFIGSDNWVALLSREAPVRSKNTRNPFGAGAAACIAVANVFRAVFAPELGEESLDTELEVSMLDLKTVSNDASNPRLSPVRMPDVHLVGVGAIGNGFIWVLKHLQCSGKLYLVDPESIEDSNLQRYVSLDASDVGRMKVDVAHDWLRAVSGLEVVPSAFDWATHISAIDGHKARVVISAVDSADARIQIQSSLPRNAYNAWTQQGEAGLSRHAFEGDLACLACLYIPTHEASNEDALVLNALRLPEDPAVLRDVRQRLQLSILTDRAFLDFIAEHSGVPIEALLPFENTPLRDLYVQGVCGGAVLQFGGSTQGARADVPMGFQSCFAGILLAAELARSQPLSENITQIDMLRRFPDYPSHFQRKRLGCICQDDDFQHVFKAKYSTNIAGSV